MNDLIEYFIKVNTDIPEDALRRNSIYYELLTYINHIIAFLICERYDEAALFVKRAVNFIEKFPNKADGYIKKCKGFADVIAERLISCKCISESGVNYLSRVNYVKRPE